jgi:hypothetical protein
MSKVPLSDQVLAVERSVVNLKDAIERLEEIIRMKKGDPSMVLTRKSHLKDLEAALESMKFLEKNSDAIKHALRSGGN